MYPTKCAWYGTSYALEWKTIPNQTNKEAISNATINLIRSNTILINIRYQRKNYGEIWTWGSLASKFTGEAVWKTPSHPATAASKEPSSIKSALYRWSLSFAPFSPNKCSVFLESSANVQNVLQYYSMNWVQRAIL